MTASVIRDAVEKDLPSLAELKQMLVAHERPLDPGIPREGIVEYYDVECLVRDPEVKFVIAETDGKITGTAYGQIRKNPDWAVKELYGHIGFMFVRDEFRQMGIGRLIIEELVQWFKSKGIHDIRLQVYSKNTLGLRAYEGYGFESFYQVLQYPIDPNDLEKP